MKRLYSVYDLKALTYSMIMGWAHDAVALRSFHDLLATEGTMPQKHPQDFELHELGVFHDDGDLPEGQSLRVVGVKPRVLATGSQWLEMQATGPQLERKEA